MSQVSRIPLRKEVEKRVYEVLMESVAVAKSPDVVERLLGDLLSPVERLMLAKRLSIALLLMRRYDQRTIAAWLKVSLGTVSKVSVALQHGKGGYASVIGTILRKEEFHALLEKIDDALADVMPPVGLNWTHWKKKRWESKLARQKAF